MSAIFSSLDIVLQGLGHVIPLLPHYYEEKLKRPVQESSGMDSASDPTDDLDAEDSGTKTNREDVLRETLSGYITDISQIEAIVNYEPRELTELDPGTVFKVLVDKMNYMWFDLFVSMGMSRRKLDGITQRYPYDANVSLFEAIVEWLNGDDPKPSWKALADALRFKMLEPKLADEIIREHFSAKEYAEVEEYRKGTSSDAPQQDDGKDGSLEFSKLIMEITDLIGPESFAEFYYYLKELCCTDGTRFVDESYFKESQCSPDSAFIAFLYNNLIVYQDLDVINTIAQGLGRDDILQLIEDYNSKLTVGHPFLQDVQDTKNFFAVYLELVSNVTDLDVEGVSLIKENICEVLGVAKLPYLLQFLGWKRSPVTVKFQVHMSLVDRVVEVVHDDLESLEHYTRIEMDVRGSIFNYDLNKIKKRTCTNH